MERWKKRIDEIDDVNAFINFLIDLAKDATNHLDEWINKSITDYLGEMANWIDDCGVYEAIDWESVDYKTLATILYMGKIYE